MSRPMTADEVVAALKRWRVPFETVDGWRTRNRNQHGAWGPVHGFMIHHTGDDADDKTDAASSREAWPDCRARWRSSDATTRAPSG